MFVRNGAVSANTHVARHRHVCQTLLRGAAGKVKIRTQQRTHFHHLHTHSTFCCFASTHCAACAVCVHPVWVACATSASMTSPCPFYSSLFSLLFCFFLCSKNGNECAQTHVCVIVSSSQFQRMAFNASIKYGISKCNACDSCDENANNECNRSHSF